MIYSMGKDFKLWRMGTNTKVNGIKGNSRVLEHIERFEVESIMDRGRMDLRME